MLKRVELHNFRGFAELATDLRPVTVVIGPNSSGKTTLLHAVRIAAQLLEKVLPQSAPRIEHVDGTPWVQSKIHVTSELLLDHTELLPLADWRSLFRDNIVGEGVYLRIGLFFDITDAIEQLTVTLHCARNSQLRLAIDVRAPKLLELVGGLPKQPKRVVTDRLREHLQTSMPLAVLVPSFYGVVRQEEYRTQAVIDRLLGGGDQSHIVRNLVTRLRNDEIDRLDRFLNQALGAKLVARTAISEVERCLTLDVGFRDDNGRLELSAAGAGLVNLIALFAALERHGNQARDRSLIYLLDEPEAHLHPRLQGEMAQWVSTLVVKQFGAQVIMATHAVEIINRLAMRDDAVLLRVDRSSPSATVLRGQPEIVAELESWADMTPFSAINFLASRRVIFHEGKSDARIIRRCAELRYRTALRNKDGFDAWTFAELEGSGNHGMAKVLLNLIERVAPATASVADPLRVVTVLDRDHYRTPGMSEEKTNGTAIARTLVWNRHSIESLFLTPAILSKWLRAWLDEHTPADLERGIEDALAAADRDETLNHDALGQLQVALLRHGGSRSEQEIVRALREAKRLLKEDPATWQRGKDRARFVLSRIRASLGHEASRHFPTELPTLLDGVDTNHFGMTEPAIPPEIRALLDFMTSE